ARRHDPAPAGGRGRSAGPMTQADDVALDKARRELPAQVRRLYTHAAALIDSVEARRRHGPPRDANLGPGGRAVYDRAVDDLAASASYADLATTVYEVGRWLNAAKGGG